MHKRYKRIVTGQKSVEKNVVPIYNKTITLKPFPINYLIIPFDKLKRQ